MTKVHRTAEHRTSDKSNNRSALAPVRAAAQELHRAISDAAAKQGEAMKADLQAIPEITKAVTASVKKSLDLQSETTKRQLAEAVKYLETTEKHVVETLKTTGHALETSARRAVLDAHSAVRQISEALASERAAHDVHPQGQERSQHA